jgi:hypothetical protein
MNGPVGLHDEALTAMSHPTPEDVIQYEDVTTKDPRASSGVEAPTQANVIWSSLETKITIFYLHSSSTWVLS